MLDDFVDGELDEIGRRRVEEHLEACPECRLDRQRTVDLVQRASAMTREVETGRDLWPAIADRIREETVVPLRRRAARWVGAGAALAAAAVVALVILPRGQAPRPVADRGQAESGVRPALSTVEPSFAGYGELDRAAQDLKRVLEERKKDLSPETRKVIDENLAIIDQAIANVKRALGEDPDNQALTVLLTATYQRKIELLKLATEASRRT